MFDVLSTGHYPCLMYYLLDTTHVCKNGIQITRHQINNTFEIYLHLHGKPGGVDNHTGSNFTYFCYHLTGMHCSGLRDGFAHPVSSS